MSRRLLVVMGPSGCGKSRIGAALADAVGATFLEGDDFHPQSNRDKMASGQPLTDADRAPWTDQIDKAVSSKPGQQIVLACSALTTYVQERLRGIEETDIRFVLLDAPSEVLARRMANRPDHFMPESLLESQLAALQRPHDAITVDARLSVDTIVALIVGQLNDEPHEQDHRKSDHPDQS